MAATPNPDWSIGAAPPKAALARRLWLTSCALRYAAGELTHRGRGLAELERVRDERVRRIVAHAHRNVPFYREQMRRAGIGPQEIRGAADLAKLPVIERDQLQADPERFMDQSRRQEECVVFRSGGSAGRPITVIHDLRDLIEKASAVWRVRQVLAELGLPRARRRIARVEPPKSSGEKLATAVDQNNLLRRLDPRRVEARLGATADTGSLIEALNSFGPDVISGYGSIVEELLGHRGPAGLALQPPAAIVYGGDGMSDGARNLAMNEGSTPVFSTYQAVESPLIGFECNEHTGMHANIDLCPIRIVDEHGSEKGPGEHGEVLISNLVCRATVLLNYRLGDIASWAEGPCPCGRALPVLSLIQGRTGIHFTDQSGRRIPSQLAERAFSSNREVLSYRVAQDDPGVLIGSAVAAPGVNVADLEQKVRQRYATLVGKTPRLEVRFVDKLPKTAAGKVCRAAVSLPAG